jgi:hypothetical protein
MWRVEDKTVAHVGVWLSLGTRSDLGRDPCGWSKIEVCLQRWKETRGTCWHVLVDGEGD